MSTNNKIKNNFLKINGKKIGEEFPTYFIADIAANHDGDLNRAKELIYLCAEAGADAAKFQHFQANTIVSDKGFKNLKKQLSHQSKWKKSVFEVYQDASLNLEWTVELKKTAEKAKIAFFSTPYSLEAVDYLDKFVPAYKIGSGDITWHEMLIKVSEKKKPFFLATGASNQVEIDYAVSICKKINPNFCIMQCNTNYTGSLENFNFIQLNVLKKYKELYPDLILGLSDHTPGHSTCLGAVTLGARAIEKHFTDDTSREGPDHQFSMDYKGWKEMVDRTRELEIALGGSIKKIEKNEEDTVVLQRRSMRSRKLLKKGTIIKFKDFIALRPCPRDAIKPCDFDKFVGKKLNIDIEEGDYLKKIFLK